MPTAVKHRNQFLTIQARGALKKIWFFADFNTLTHKYCYLEDYEL